MFSRSRFVIASVAVLTAVVLITYQPALRLNFYGDDYSFLETAGRSSLAQYLAFYFDPRLQTGWYRPLQGMLFGIEWVLFGGNPVGYHLVNLLVHLANCLVLFTLVGVVSEKWRVALLSALIYAGLPLYGVAVFWPGNADFLLTFFYLSSILFWALHLPQGQRRFYILSFVFFLLALTTKEFGVTLPVILFLVDRLLLREKASVVMASGAKQSPTRDGEIASSHKPLLAMTMPMLLRRYVPFLIVYLLYLPLEYDIQSRSVLTNMYGYSIADHVVSNFVQYLAALAFPWGLPEPLNYIGLVVAILVYGFIALKKKSARLGFLAIAAVLTFLPVTPFPWFFTRYLYLAVMASAIAIASLVEWVATRFAHSRWLAPSASAAIALVVLGNTVGSASAAADFAELGRQTRVPFRDLTQRHPTFPDDTYLYFIDSPTITSQLSGMFFLRYGAGVRVASNEHGGVRANLRDHQNAYVIYFDEQRRTRELPVDKQMPIEARPRVPLDFVVPIQLGGFETPSARARRGDAVVVILYWRATGKIEKNYVVSMQLVDGVNHVIVSDASEPHGGTRPTSTWQPGELVVDARVLMLPRDVPVSSDYRIEIELFDSETLQQVEMHDGRDGKSLVLSPFAILD
jgi:hypothetical protein